MKILFAASEVYPFAKTGGLADVVASLTNELCRLGHDVKLLLPGYPQLHEQFKTDFKEKSPFPLGQLSSYELSVGKLPNLNADVVLVESERAYGKSRQLYSGTKLNQFVQYLLLSHAAARVTAGRGFNWHPDVIHANDWHSGLAFNFMEHFGVRDVARVFSVHNIAFPGKFPLSYWSLIGDNIGELAGGKFLGNNEFSFLEEALLLADKVNTVSESYSEEIQGPVFGFGFEDILTKRHRDLHGILNGVDYGVWHPEQDRHLPLKSSSYGPEEKARIKTIVQQRFGLPQNPDALLCSFTNRLTHQKMVDIVTRAVERADREKFQFVFHGNGQDEFVAAVSHISSKSNVSYLPGFKEATEHQLLAGADVCLSPSRFEPCGLNALYAMRYGALPLVRPVGGYRDTVKDIFSNDAGAGRGNGFYAPAESVEGLHHALERIYSVYQDKREWNQFVDNAKRENFSWSESGRRYVNLYNLALRKKSIFQDFTQLGDNNVVHAAQKMAG